MTANVLNVEGFNPSEWDIRREGRVWSHEEFERRIYQAPEKIEYTGGIFTYEDERLTVLAMLLENLGIDKAVQLGNLEDWKAAIAQMQEQSNKG
ncbi:MAG TPA: hypothetical protein VLL54_06730 [Pyrinomonadaceae bacterium]|nr:hypothetical protein [Pyrinomonadaceae bacterium]